MTLNLVTTLCLVIPVITLFIHRWLIRPHKYWLERGVKQTKPVFLFGDSFGTAFRKQSPADMLQMVYNAVLNSRFSGMYQFLAPTLVLKDPELIKQITVKDFDHFVNRRTVISTDADPFWANNPLALTDQKWRDMRATLSPAFTSSKMKYIFSLMLESGNQFIQHFLRQNKEVITLEMKDTYTRFTNDVIANTVFGVKCDSLEDPKNEFYLMGRELTSFNGFWKMMKMIGFLLLPQLKIFNVPLFSNSVSNFFKRLVSDNIATREKLDIVRPDVINLLLEVKNNSLKKEESQSIDDAAVKGSQFKKTASRHEITNVELTAQVLIFFLAGFETVSFLMCFLSYELAANPDVQRKLIQEVDENIRKCNGKLTYEILTGMKYLDMVISETLRLWPTTVFTDRVCTKPYTIQPETPDEKPLDLEIGTLVWIPVYSIHRDPKYFSDPNRFDPERFSDENKASITQYTYLPFGCGPRNCIGSRFALLEAKTLFFYILSQFEIVPVGKSTIPLKLSQTSVSMTAENGFWFGFKRRNTPIANPQ